MSLVARDIYKIYKTGAKEVKALNGINLEVGKSASTAIVGPSGAGKSTLLHILGGLDRPTSGEVLLDGANLYRLSDSERARARNTRIGFVFQFYHLLPELTALENVMMPAYIRNQKPETRNQINNRAKNILRLVGLEDRINHRPRELSGGEAQRVAIGRALINEPEMLLCDEPTGNLDSKTSEGIYELLFRVKSIQATALVIVTHDEGISAQCERTIHIRDGKIA